MTRGKIQRHAYNFDNFMMHLLILSFIPWRKYTSKAHVCHMHVGKNSLNHRQHRHTEEEDEPDGNCIRDPAVERCNVNLWVYIANRKRARNSSVRSEGRWYVPVIPILLERTSYAKRCCDIFFLIGSNTSWCKLFMFKPILFTVKWSFIKYNQKIKIILSFTLVSSADNFAVLLYV